MYFNFDLSCTFKTYNRCTSDQVKTTTHRTTVLDSGNNPQKNTEYNHKTSL